MPPARLPCRGTVSSTAGAAVRMQASGRLLLLQLLLAVVFAAACEAAVLIQGAAVCCCWAGERIRAPRAEGRQGGQGRAQCDQAGGQHCCCEPHKLLEAQNITQACGDEGVQDRMCVLVTVSATAGHSTHDIVQGRIRSPNCACCTFLLLDMVAAANKMKSERSQHAPLQLLTKVS